VLVDLHVVLAVGEAVERDSARLTFELATDLLSKARVRSTGEDLQGTVQGEQIVRYGDAETTRDAPPNPHHRGRRHDRLRAGESRAAGSDPAQRIDPRGGG